MATMDEVLERLDATEKQAAEIVRQMEETESLHKSLIETRKSLETVTGDVGRLIAATLKGVEALHETVTAFKTATETFQRADPGVVTATLKEMDSTISAIRTEIVEVTTAVAETLSANEERMRTMIDNAVDEVRGQSLTHRLLGRKRAVKSE